MARAILIQYVYMAGPILPQFVHITGVIMGGLYTPLGGKNGRVVSKPPVLYTPLGGKMVGLFQSHLYCTHQRVEKSYTVHITAWKNGRACTAPPCLNTSQGVLYTSTKYLQLNSRFWLVDFVYMFRNNPFLSFTPMVFPYRVNHFTLLNVRSQHTSETSLQIFHAESTQVFRTESTIPSHFPCRVNHPFKFFPCRVNTSFPYRVNHPFKFFRVESTIPSSFSVPS